MLCICHAFRRKALRVSRQMGNLYKRRIFTSNREEAVYCKVVAHTPNVLSQCRWASRPGYFLKVICSSLVCLFDFCSFCGHVFDEPAAQSILVKDSPWVWVLSGKFVLSGSRYSSEFAPNPKKCCCRLQFSLTIIWCITCFIRTRKHNTIHISVATHFRAELNITTYVARRISETLFNLNKIGLAATLTGHE